MMILDEKGIKIFNSEFIESYTLSYKDSGDVLVVATYSDERVAKTLGAYKDHEEAKNALDQLFGAFSVEQAYFSMPLSRKRNEEFHIKDARTKRKGGS